MLGFTGCGEKVDAKRVEKSIKDAVEEQDPDAKPVAVTCPKDRERKKGDTFKCQVRGAKASQRALVTVTQSNDKGQVALPDLCAPGALPGFAPCGEGELDMAAVEKAIKQNVERQHPAAKPVSAMCPERRQRRKGDTFKCQVRGAKRSQRAVATVTQLNSRGAVRFVVP